MIEVLVTRFQCECVTIKSSDPTIPGKSGLYGFIRVKDGVHRDVVIAVENESHAVQAVTVDYVCRNLGIDNPRDLTHSHQLVKRTMAEERYRALLSSMFGLTALVLCAIGVYGLLTREVADRSREIGLRIALGARPADVLRLIGRQGLILVGGGLLLGVPAALATGQLIRSLLFGVTPGAPVVLLITAATLMLAASGATLIPARRASRVDPSALLRAE